MMRVRLLLVLLLAVGSSTVASAAEGSPPLVQAVDSVVIPVTDMQRSVRFYTQVLQFRPLADREVADERYERLYGVFGARVRSVRLALGDERVELVQFRTPRGRPAIYDSRANDRWFEHIAIIVRDMPEAHARLRRFGVEYASSGPQKLPATIPPAAGIEAFYFRDPDGNFLEVLHFPPGKGAPRWHDHRHLFLGIDHTAIVVADTAASLAWYRDRLGFVVAGSSDNFGNEQEHLNNVRGAHLRITALRSTAGPGIELLEYLEPRSGRPMPADTLPNDHWYWQINLRVDDVAAAGVAADDAHAPRVSDGPVETPRHELGIASGLIVRDPDGHANLLFRPGN